MTKKHIDNDQNPNSKIHIYVLKLENENYYVGQTKNIEKRLKFHNKGKLGSDWTKLHSPIEIYKSKETPFTTVQDAIKLENLTTIWCMKKFGWKNVRGGDFCTLDENKLRFLLAINSDLREEILPVSYSPNLKLERGINYIFILELEKRKFFVGFTTNIFLAIINEYNALGAPWTKKYKPLKLVKVYRVDQQSKNPKRELINSFVIKYMRKYDFKDVRGGDFFNIDARKHKNKVLNYTDIFK
jgi:predicted GIY-YIG superfamily endonuclease